MYNKYMKNFEKTITKMQLEIDRLQSIISQYEDNSDNYAADYTDTVTMPRGLFIRQKIQWCYQEREDNSGKLNRVLIDEKGCHNWTGRVRTGYGIIDCEGKKFRVHTLIKILQDIPETTPLWEDNLNICALYKQKTTIEKLVGAHSCHNKRCINPAHVELKSNAENRMDSFYKATQTKGSERQQKLIYDFFLEMTDYYKIQDQLHEYTKTIGLEVAITWAYCLVRGEKYLTTPLGQEYKGKLAKKWLDINEKNKKTIFPKFLK